MKRWVSTRMRAVKQAYNSMSLFSRTTISARWYMFACVLVLAAVLVPQPAHAIFEGIVNGILSLISSLLLELAKLCIFLTIFFLRFFITLASYNNYIDVAVVQLGWVMVRDVANMFFIVGLLVIAFATILGFENYEWKRGLVKIILMAILINFSNLIAQMIIDVAHVFTVTFLNAVSATAGGNLVNMFKLTEITQLVQGGPSEAANSPGLEGLLLFAAAVLAFLFAFIAALTLGSYVVVMMARIVVLWALIILAPLAFMLYALPSGEKYAQEWWKEFSKHVIVAPIMVFFLWLAFATLGTGQVILEIQNSGNVIPLEVGVTEQSASISRVSTWENMASFLLAVAFLWVGLKKTQETGVMGADAVTGAMGIAKKGARVASGYAAGRWAAGKAWGGVKGTAKGAGKLGLKGLGAVGMRAGGANIKEAVSKLKSDYVENRVRAKIKRSELAKSMEEIGGVQGWIAARLIEPHERALKRADRWKEKAETMKKIQEKSYTDSHSVAGQAELKAELELKRVTARGEKKGQVKREERLRGMDVINQKLDEIAQKNVMNTDGEYKAMNDSHEQAKKEREELENKIADQIRAEFLATLGGTMADMDLLTEKERSEMDKKVSEGLQEQLEKEDSELSQKTASVEAVDKRKTKLLKEKTKDEREKIKTNPAILAEVKGHLLQEMAPGDKVKQAKFSKIIDRDGGIQSRIAEAEEQRKMTETEMTEGARVEEFSKETRRTRELQEAIAKDKVAVANKGTARFEAQVQEKHAKERTEEMSGLNFRELTKQAGELAKELQKAVGDPKLTRNLAATLSAAMQKGSETGMAALNEILKKVDTNGQLKHINANDMVGQQRKIMSALTGKVVQENELASTYDSFFKLFGRDQANAIIKNLDAGFKTASSDGAVNLAGVFDDSQLRNGKVTFTLRPEIDKSKFREMREYFAQEINITKLTGVEDMINTSKQGATLKVVSQDGTATSALDQQAVNQMVTALSQAKPNTRFHGRFIKSIQNLHKTDPDGLQAVLSKLNPDAKAAIGRLISNNS